MKFMYNNKSFYFIVLSLLLSTIYLPSCSSDSDEFVPELSVTSSSPIIAYNKSVWEVQVTSTAKSNWTLSIRHVDSAAEWATASSTSGGEGTTNLMIMADSPNNSNEERVLIVTVTADTLEEQLTLKQQSKTSSGGEDNPGGGTTTEPDYSMRYELPKIKDLTSYLEYTVGDFYIEYDKKRLHPKWVAWTMDAALHEGSAGRNQDWKNDSRIDINEQAWHSDFQDLGSAQGLADRGHLCPSADRQKTVAMNQSTFYYTNMTPQVNAFNSGIWATLETAIRAQSFTHGYKLYVCAGGALYNSDVSFANETAMTIAWSSRGMPKPKYNYKVVLRDKGDGTYDAIGFWFENRAYTPNSVSGNIEVIKTVREIETLTGLDFFHGLPSDIQNVAETTCRPSDWGF